MSKKEETHTSTAIPKAQRNSTNPLAPKTSEQEAEIKQVRSEIVAAHKKTQNFVADKFTNDPKAIWIDKGNT